MLLLLLLRFVDDGDLLRLGNGDGMSVVAIAITYIDRDYRYKRSQTDQARQCKKREREEKKEFFLEGGGMLRWLEWKLGVDSIP